MITCPRCHHLNQDGTTSCELCGASLAGANVPAAKGKPNTGKGKFPGAPRDSSPPPAASGPSGLAKLLQDALSTEPDGALTAPPKRDTLQNTPGIGMLRGRKPKEDTPAPGLSGYLLDALQEEQGKGSAAVAPSWDSQEAGHGEVAVGGAPATCATCGAANPEGMYYCVHCGSALDGSGATESSVEEVACSACGTANVAGSRFCGACGFPTAAKAGEATWEAPEAEPQRLVSPWDVRLVSINEDGSDGVEIPLNYLQTIIGRSGDTRFPTDAFLSPKHAALNIEDAALSIEDLYSLNGTFVKLRDEVELSAGDLFLMGRQVLRFERFEQTITPKARSSDGTRYMGSPPPGGQNKLLQIGIGGVVQNVYCIPETGAVLGREQGEIIFPRDKFMSGRHAQIYQRDDGQYCLVDLNSSNGTWIKIWEKTPLHHTDHIFLGQQLFRVEMSGNPA